MAGDAKIGVHFEQIRAALLQQARDKKQLQHDVVSMRDKMRMMHPDKPNMFDVKQARGGIIDVEFIVQFLVLVHANEFPQLVENIGNIALIERFYTLGIIDQKTAENVINAYRHYRSVQHRLKLQASSDTSVTFLSVEAHANAVKIMWNKMLDI